MTLNEAKSPKLEYTISDLLKSTMKLRDDIKNRVTRVVSSTVIPRTKSVVFQGESRGTKLYPVVIAFYGVNFSQTKSSATPIETKTKDGETWFMEKLDSKEHKVQVRCQCADYYFTWQYYNRMKHALHGKAFPAYVRKTSTYPERNPIHVPGLCKHLYRFAERLKVNGVLDM